MKKAYKHDYSGSCVPGSVNISYTKSGKHYTGQHTFSVGIFQWLPKSSGKGLKKSAVKFRIKGNVNDAEKVYKKAKECCKMMDDGLIFKTKSMTV